MHHNAAILGSSRSGEVSGVIELDGRYAFPSMEETDEGLESLNLTSNLLDEDKPNRQEEVPKQVGNEGLEPLRVKANIGRRNRRGRGAKKAQFNTRTEVDYQHV